MTKVIIRRKARKITNELDALDFAKAVNKASIPLNTKPKGLVLRGIRVKNNSFTMMCHTMFKLEI